MKEAEWAEHKQHASFECAAKAREWKRREKEKNHTA
jgi:hypothetical protein